MFFDFEAFQLPTILLPIHRKVFKSHKEGRLLLVVIKIGVETEGVHKGLQRKSKGRLVVIKIGIETEGVHKGLQRKSKGRLD